MKQLWVRWRAPVFLVTAICAVFWKTLLTNQYTMLEAPDIANEVLPWLQLQVRAIRGGSIALWTPYEWFGHTLIGQFEPGVCSPFTYLLALGPLDGNGHLQVRVVHVWMALIHCAAGLFAYLLFRDLRCSRAGAATGGLLYATAGVIGNTLWPQFLTAAIWGPLVFLFLLRSLRGRMPLKSAGWAGAAMGMSWLSGHHSPAICLTLASFGTGFVVMLLRWGAKWQAVRRLGVMLAVMAMVGSLQALPVFEYGRLSLRWISTGPLGWKDVVPFPEHLQGALPIPNILHLFVPGGTGTYADPFIGVVGLSLAALAILCCFRQIEMRIFGVLALSTLLFALAKDDVFYGPLYALVPLVEKAREPVVVLGVFDLAVAALAAFGMDQLLAGGAVEVVPRVAKVLGWFAGVTCALFFLAAFLRPTLTSGIAHGDSRVGMIALISLGAAGLLLAWNRGVIGRRSLVLMLCAALMIEQGVESDWNYVQKDDKTAIYLKPIFGSEDVAGFLRSRPDPKRVEISRPDVPFSFANWYGIDAPEELTSGLLESTYRLGWSSDRLSRMYGENYTVSRTSTHAGQQDLFTGKSGLKVFANPEAFPRAWTVHQIQSAKDDGQAVTLVRDGAFDLRSAAVMTGGAPRLEKCAGEDRVDGFREDLSSVHLAARMSCTGLVIVSDSDYPGWRAEVDGRPAKIWRVNTVIRGVVVGAGEHQIVMKYRPVSVYLGLGLALLGLALAVLLQVRREADGVDLLSAATSLSSL